MSTASNVPATTPTPLRAPSPSSSPLAKSVTGSSSSPTKTHITLVAPAALLPPPLSSSTLNVPKSTPTKPSRQATNPDKDRPTPLPVIHSATSGLPSGLPPSAPSLSPGMTRLGTRSPSSIPSSPTSIHSSSSAIFERDIEPLGLPALGVPLNANPAYPSKSGLSNLNPAANSNQHRIPRSKNTEALELTVPSVLDSAAIALTSPDESGANITVLSPVPQNTTNPLTQSHSASVLQSPLSQSSPVGAAFPPNALNSQGGIGSLGSISGTSGGSPSPPTMSLLLQGMGMSGLVSASASVSGPPSQAGGFASGFASPLSSSRSPSPARSASSPAKNFAELTPAGNTGSPTLQSKEVINFTSSPLKRPSLPPPTGPGLGANASASSPSMRATNRLSFISYNDVLTSAPIAAQPLSTVLTGQNEPPTHLVVVDPDNASSALGMTPTTSTGNLPLTGVGSLNVTGASDKIDVDSLGTVGLSSTGEWGREGLGGGLEERLERLWAAEKEMTERGRVMAPPRIGSTSRSASMGANSDASPAVTAAPIPALVVNPLLPTSAAPTT